MKKTITMLLFCAMLLLTACNDKEAREYSGRLAEALKAYKAEINDKIKAERKSYNKLAGVYADAQKVDAVLSLDADRLRRAAALADKMLQGGKLGQQEISTLLADYAKQDFDATRAIFEKETDDQASFLTGLDNLELQAQNVDALILLLEEMAKPTSSKAVQLRLYGEFALKVKEGVYDLRCKSWASQIKCLEAAKTAATTDAAKKQIQADIDALTAQFTDTQCSAALRTSAQCPN